MSSSSDRYDVGIVWLRRDLRLDDNVALHEACMRCRRVCIAFVVNPPLLANGRIGAPIVGTFFDALGALRADLRARGGDLAILRGDFQEELAELAARVGAAAIFYNEDYEPEAIRRDAAVAHALAVRGIATHAFLDHVYFGANEIETGDGTPYRVFTPYKRRWLERHAAAPRPPVPSRAALHDRLLQRAHIGVTSDAPSPGDYGFEASASYPRASEALARDRLAAFLAADGPAERYKERRDLPAADGTSFLSPQLRAGTIGIRTCVEAAYERAAATGGRSRESVETWISELIWREFYQTILRRYPHVVDGPFIEAASTIPWRDDPAGFDAWCHGATGFPIVDAAMRQLNETGWMHNRLRMIVASFLSKHLLIDWRKGERYFERRLADADLAQNNGGWQWAASTGTDAAPYFRIFNPTLQGRRFDPDGAFIRRMVPELAHVPTEYVHEPWRIPPLMQAELGLRFGTTYPAPVVDHPAARERALAAYASVLRR